MTYNHSTADCLFHYLPLTNQTLRTVTSWNKRTRHSLYVWIKPIKTLRNFLSGFILCLNVCVCVCTQLDQVNPNFIVILHNKSHLESTRMDSAILPSLNLLTLTKCRKPAILYVNQKHSLLAVSFNVATLVTSNVTFYLTRGKINYRVI